MDTVTVETSELIGPALDWAVAKCGDVSVEYINDGITKCLLLTRPLCGKYSPSTAWAQGGPIIERERITLGFRYSDVTTESGTKITIDVGWRAHITPRHFWKMPRYSEGPTPLIAAMRCYVASKLGDTVQIPEGLPL